MDEGTRKLIEEIDNRLSNRYMVYEQVGNSLTVKERENGKLYAITVKKIDNRGKIYVQTNL